MQYEIKFVSTHKIDVEAPNKELAEKIARIEMWEYFKECIEAGDFDIESTKEVG